MRLSYPSTFDWLSERGSRLLTYIKDNRTEAGMPLADLSDGEIDDITSYSWGDCAWPARQDASVIRASAAAGDTISRLPSARFFSSTLPSARPAGPTSTCQGMPIRSAVANFPPARSSRSS